MMAQESSGLPISSGVVDRQQKEPENNFFDTKKWLVMAEEISRLAEQGRNIIVYGPTRTGKTSIARYLVNKESRFSVKQIGYMLERGPGSTPSIEEICRGILEFVFRREELPSNSGGVVQAAREWAGQVRKEGKIPVVFFDEWQCSAVAGEEQAKSFYLELARELFASKDLVNIHSFVNPVNDKEVGSLFPSLFQPDVAVFETKNLTKALSGKPSS